MDFLRSYIHLMRLRTGSYVDVSVNIPQGNEEDVYVAPLIFISLVENAFKHGVSTSEASFINISITVTDQNIHCVIANSNHPKTDSDRSGNGIGLKNLRRRLDLIYQKQYTFTTEVKDDTYIATLDVPKQKS